MELKVGKLYTLLLFSKNAGGFSPAQVDLMAEVGRCLEDRYQLRREADTRNTLANLSTCSVLLSAIKVSFAKFSLSPPSTLTTSLACLTSLLSAIPVKSALPVVAALFECHTALRE